MADDSDRVAEFLDSMAPYEIEPQVYCISEGARVRLRPTHAGDAVYLASIATEADVRQRGLASETLRHVCELADAHGVELVLEVERSDAGGLEDETLLAWYRRYGFEGEQGEMIRSPRQRA